MYTRPITFTTLMENQAGDPGRVIHITEVLSFVLAQHPPKPFEHDYN